MKNKTWSLAAWAFILSALWVMSAHRAESAERLASRASDRARVVSLADRAGSGVSYFADDFDRPDGPVENGWSTWWGNSFDSPNIRLVEGELNTVGFPGLAGGVFRSLPVGLPLAFAFDFRTFSVRECSPEFESWSNDGGWLIRFNVREGFHPYNAPAQVEFYQYSGLRHVHRAYLTDMGMFADVSSPALEPLPGQREFQPDAIAHIEGVIDTDLSAEIAVYYNDGEKPDPVTFSFRAAVDATPTPPGTRLVFGNSSCASGPHILDNLEILYQSPEK